MLIDVHVHTTASACSSLTLEDIVVRSARLGLNGVCITDHHCVDALRYVRPGMQANGLRLFVGQEYHTDHGDFLIFGPQEPLPTGLTAKRLLAWVAETGGAAIAAHPFRKAKPTADFVIRNQWCRIVESVNGRNQAHENHATMQWINRYPLIECAGSDAHTLEELGRICTRFHLPIDTMDDLIFALNNGYCEPFANIPLKKVS